MRWVAVSRQVVVAAHGRAIEAGLLEATVAEAAALVADSDLTVTALSLQLVTAVLRRQPKAGPAVASQVAASRRPPMRAGAAAACCPTMQNLLAGRTFCVRPYYVKNHQEAKAGSVAVNVPSDPVVHSAVTVDGVCSCSSS